VDIEHKLERAGDIRHSQGEPGLAKMLLGIEAETGLADGLRSTAAWMRSAQ
jgi:hypothetical protein